MSLQGIEFGAKPVTVRDLIENLRSLDPDALVMYYGREESEMMRVISVGYTDAAINPVFSYEAREEYVPVILIS